MSAGMFFAFAAAPAALTAIQFWRWCRMVDELRTSAAPQGHVAGAYLLFGVLLPSATAWLAWLLWGLLLWVSA